MKDKKRMRVFLAAAVTAAVLTGLTACSAADKTGNQVEKSSEAAAEDSPAAGESGLSGSGAAREAGQESRPEDTKELLARMTAAIEAQFPGGHFTDLPEGEIEISFSLLKDSYLFAGRESDLGFSYIAGVCLLDENPLDGMNCGMGSAASGFVTSQFADGRFLLMEKNEEDGPGLSGIYAVLQRGDAGVDALADAASRGNSFVMPENSPFLRVLTVKEQAAAAEYIPLTMEEYHALQDGTPAVLEKGASGTLMLCRDSDEQLKWWNEATPYVTEEMIKLAEERCGYVRPAPVGEESFVKAEFYASLYGEERSETLQNRDDLDRLYEAVSQIQTDGDFRDAGSYDGRLTLYRQDGTDVQIALKNGDNACVIGGSLFGNFVENGAETVWSLFTTIDGWRRYGEQIRMTLTEDSYAADESQLEFVLENKTGGPIQYILSPIVYKKEGSGWRQLEAVGGFCGFLSPMEGEEEKLTVPWNGIFLAQGKGTYKLEIQVMPEDGIRFPISDTFELTDEISGEPAVGLQAGDSN